MDKLYGLDYLLLVMNLYSYYLIGCKKNLGFLLGIIGSVIGLILFSFVIKSIPMIIMYLSFAILNYANYIKWKTTN
mgnify:FL=1